MGHIKKIHHAEQCRVIHHPARTARLAQAPKEDPREWKGEDATYYSWVPEHAASQQSTTSQDQKGTDKDKD